MSEPTTHSDSSAVAPEPRTPLCCGLCGAARSYSSRHDAYFCAPCALWLEPPCSDTTCTFCVARPSAPPVSDARA